MNIALCGMMGCGKTTVARIIAQKYGRPLIDVDCEIVKSFGPIQSIFSERGEEFFRKIESQTIDKICSEHSQAVIALGGGAVLRRENIERLKSCSKLVYLRTKAENLVKRLENTDDRPLLNGTMRDRVIEILAERAPVYERAADKIIDTDGLSPENVAEAVWESVK